MPTVRALLPLALLTAGLAAPVAGAAEPPRIANVAVLENTPDKVVFSATVDPGDLETRVRLEFGTTPALGAQSSALTIAADAEPTLVQITLRSQPGTTYSWRLTATNAASTVSTEVAAVTTPARTQRRVVPVVRLSFAVEAFATGTRLGRLLGITRPHGLPAGTRVQVRCRSLCTGGRAFTIRASSKPSALLRFAPPIVVRRRSVVEIRAVRKGYLGRVRHYRFRRSGRLLEPRRLFAGCLTDERPARPTACRG